MQHDTFIERWTESLELGSAALFVGAGLSQRAGYPGWRALLKDVAHELGLDIEEEYDLAAVAQYSVNRAVGKRNQLARLIAREFAPKTNVPEPFRILARLPIRHIWTTNYDTLLEGAWRDERKLLDVKSRNEDLGVDKPWAHAILYKMHGSVDHPADVVIAKDDYELYRRMRPGFLQVLNGHLIGKQILFLGFSFTDQNLAHIFESIRETFQQDGPEHYAIVRRPAVGSGPRRKQRLEVDSIRHELWVEDLQRYGIQCIEVDKYEDIDEILRDIELRLARRSVFVSGSYPHTFEPDDLDGRRFVEAVAREVGRVVAERRKRLVSGFGLVVGSAAISGALGIVLGEDAPNLEKSLLLRPFPQEAPRGTSPDDFKRRYREGMLQQAGVCVFIAGLKDVDHGGTRKRMVADGVIAEFEGASKLRRALIPIGATGGAAAELWQRVDADFTSLWPPGARKDFDLLNDPSQLADVLAEAVGRMIDVLEDPKPKRKTSGSRSRRPSRRGAG